MGALGALGRRRLVQPVSRASLRLPTKVGALGAKLKLQVVACVSPPRGSGGSEAFLRGCQQ